MSSRIKKKVLDEALIPPRAKKSISRREVHDTTLEDNYAWLRDRTNPETDVYLEAENAYTKRAMVGTEELSQKIFSEMKGRMKEADESVPVQKDNYFYYTRLEKGKQYGIFCRKKDSLNSPEEILFDGNEEAAGKSFFHVGFLSVSPNHRKLAYSINTDGSDRHTMYIKNLSSGETYDIQIENVWGDFEWGNDSSTFFYVTIDDLLRPSCVYRGSLGEQCDANGTLLYEENDQKFLVSLDKSRDEKYIFIHVASKITTEVRYFKANMDGSKLHVFAPRHAGIEYYLDEASDFFYILTNEDAVNFRLLQTPTEKQDASSWEEVVPGRQDVKIEGIDLFKNFMVVYEMREGISSFQIHHFETGEVSDLGFRESMYTSTGSSNPNFETDSFRYHYTSFTVPNSIYEYNLVTGSHTLLKQEEVVGGYDEHAYAAERIYAKADDGEEVPISLVYRKDMKKDEGNPLWLLGYGSYGMSLPITFSKNRLSLLDRGFIFAIAHIRGGGEKGEKWRDDGKLFKKKNTFTDYISCAEKLISEKYTTTELLLACGRSAGGLLMGAVLGERPELFGAMVADVPFVDVINTMLDPSLPLTVEEYEEWGNPNEKESFEYMKSYAPYENVQAQDFPPMFVSTGVNDTRVPYWEPAKWVAKIRDMKTDENPLLFKIEMGAGHAGASGRYDSLKEIAIEYAFAIDILEEAV